MITILKVAWRSIWRTPRRTLISMGAVGVGLILVIFYTGMMGGILGEAKEQMDSTGMGHVEVTAPGWRLHRGAAESLAEPTALLGRLTLPPGSEVGVRVVARGLLSSPRGSEGVELFGADWEREEQLCAWLRDVREGERPAPGDDRGILIGEKLAERLKVKVGAKVRLMGQRVDGELSAQLFRVRGIFRSLSPAISQRRVMASQAAVRELLGVGDVAHLIVVQRERAAEADPLKERLRGELGEGYEVLSYGDLMPMLRQMEQLGDAFVWIAALFIYSLVGLGILNTLLMSVMERRREFGMLRAIGTRPARVVAQVLGESFWIATLSAAAGLVLGLLLTWYGSTHSLMHIGGTGEGMEYAGAVIEAAIKTRFSPKDALTAAGLVYVMALVVALYPAWKVAKLPPAQALHSS